MKIDNPIVSGSLIVSGSTTITGYLSASTFVGDGSGLSNMYTDSDTLSYINSLSVISSSAQLSTEISGAFVSISASLASRTSVLEQFSSSLDATFATDSELSTVSSSLASNISTNDGRLTTLEGKTLVSSSAQLSNQTIPGDLTVGGILTAQEFHTEFVSASIIYDSGSTKFGDTSDDIHQFTGSIQQSGSNSYFLGNIGIGTTSPSAKLDVVGDVEIDGKLDLNDGSNRVFVGTNAGTSNTGATSNGFGSQALRYNIGASSNGFGHQALYDNTGTNSNGFGHQALYDNTGATSNGFGSQALRYNIGANSNGFGHTALYDNTGANSNGFGHTALYNNTGTNSNGFGLQALTNNTGASSNGFGNYALSNNKAANNTAIGHQAGYETSDLTGGSNTFLGYNASYGANTTITNATAVGANVTLTDSNTVILGNGANVGIGTSSPTFTSGFGGLNIYDDRAAIRLISSVALDKSWENRVGGDGSFQIADATLSTIPLYIAGTGANTGNVGIGTITPNAKLHVDGDAIITGKITAQEFHTEFVSASIIYDSGSTQFGNSLDDIHNFSGSLAVNTNNLFVSGGNVGIGTNNPNRGTVVIVGDFNNFLSGNGQLAIISNVTGSVSSSNQGGNIVFGGSISSTDSDRTFGSIGGYKENDIDGDRAGYLALGTRQGTSPRDIYERLRITSSGNVGIGTTSPLYKLQVNGDISFPSRNTAGTYRIGMGREDVNGWAYTQNIGFNSDESGGYITFETQEPGVDGGEYMRITANGNVGIGTTSPDGKLHIYKGSAGSITPNSNYDELIIENSGNTGISFLTPDGNTAGLTWATPSDAFSAVLNYNNSNGLMSIGTYASGGEIEFLTGNAGTSVRIDDTGNVGINTTSPSYKLHVNGSVAGVGAYVNLSDIDYKKNIYDLTDGLDKVLQLRPVTFNWKNEDYGDRINTGFIAQEVEDVLPNSVITTEDSVKSIATSELIAVLTKAVQELKAEVNELRSEINLLKNQ